MTTTKTKTKTVWKYEIKLGDLTDYVELELPPDATLLSAVNQFEALCLYFLVTSSPQTNDRYRRVFRVVGTGHPINPQDLVSSRFVGSVPFQSGRLVFHVWELMGG